MMTQEQALQLVAYLNRAGLVIAMEGQAAVWRDALQWVRFEDAQEACRALVREGVPERFATPADVVRTVKRIRGRRIADRVPPAPPVALDPRGERDFARAYLRALGDGASEEFADSVACERVGVRRELVAGPGRNPRELIAQAAAALAVPEGN